MAGTVGRAFVEVFADLSKFSPGLRQKVKAALDEQTKGLQFDELEFLPYADKELANAPHEEIRRTLVAIIRRERPPVVVTFDPNGMTLHADHLAISRFTSDAIAAALLQSAKKLGFPPDLEGNGLPQPR